MAYSQAATVRKALADMGLIDEHKRPEVNEVLSRKRAEAARKSHEVRKAKKMQEELAKGGVLQNGSLIAKNPVVATDTSKTQEPKTGEKEGETGGQRKGNFAISTENTGDTATVQNLQIIQQAKVSEARNILNDSAAIAAGYMRDLVLGAIPDAPERLRFEAAKVILQSQGVTGEQQSDNSRKDINSMSKADLMAFIHAGTAELNRIQQARIIDIEPEPLDTESN